MKPKIHIADPYIMNPSHPITINVIGCGGTGSQVLTCLARIHSSLIALGHPGLYVIAYDHDIVSQSNIGRQLFSPADLGLNKANVLVSRINSFMGTSWESIPHKFSKKTVESCNITLTCVDTISARLEVDKILKDEIKSCRYIRSEPYMIPMYWMDFGNGTSSGQVVLGTLSKPKKIKSRKFTIINELPTATERFNYDEIDETDSGPSCSLAEALQKQDLFINSTLAQLGCNLLWKLIREGMIDKAGLFLNLETMNVKAIDL